jgi:hypothetical protein
MNPATPTDWAEWLAAFRQRLVAAHDEKESNSPLAISPPPPKPLISMMPPRENFLANLAA